MMLERKTFHRLNVIHCLGIRKLMQLKLAEHNFCNLTEKRVISSEIVNCKLN